MTREEAIKILKSKMDGTVDTSYEWAEAVRMAIEALHKTEWIPCEERLPEVGRSVLFSVGGMYTAEGCVRDDGNWCQFRWSSIQKRDIVDAWMPLPKPSDFCGKSGRRELMYECFHCGERAVIWDGDFSFEDYCEDGEGIIHECHCTNCGARITYRISLGDGDEAKGERG